MKKETSKFKKAVVWISALAVIFAANFSVTEKVFAATDTTNQSSQLEQAINVDQGAAGATQAQALQSAGLQDNSYDQALISTGNTGSTEIPSSYVGTGGGIGKSNDNNPAGSAGASKLSNADTIGGLNAIAYAIVWIGSRLMAFAAGMTDFAMNLGMDVTTLAAVKIGWQIVLNFTNLGFVLAIIVIAFATIFKRESYGMKKTLWRLVIAALLVNFSLVIAGGIIDFSNTVTNVFLKYTGNTANLSNALATAFGPQKLADVSNSNATGWLSTIKSPFAWGLNFLASILFAAIFTLLMVLAFLTLFVMFLMRALWLVFLLILSPIVWLCWIFPDTSQYFKQWWKNFLRWNFFSPVVLFFIYLAMATANQLNSGSTTSILNAQNTSASAASAVNSSVVEGMNQGFFGYAANLFIILGLVYGGIYAANTLGLKGGSLGVNWSSKIGKGVGSWAGRKGVRGGTWIARRKGVEGAFEGLQKVGSQFGVSAAGKFGRWLTTPIRKVGDYGKGIGQIPGKYISDTESELNKLPNADERAMRWHSLDTPGKIALLQSLRKTKDVDLLMTKADVAPEEIHQVLGQMEKYKQRVKDVTEVVPIFAMAKGVESLDENGKTIKEDIDIYHEFRNKNYDKAKRGMVDFLKKMSPGKQSAVQWNDMMTGLFMGKMETEEQKAEWGKGGATALADVIVQSSTAEGVTNLYKAFKPNERDRIHGLIVDQIEKQKIDMGAESRLAVLQTRNLKDGRPNPYYNGGLAKFFQSTLAADMGIELDESTKEASKSGKDRVENNYT